MIFQTAILRIKEFLPLGRVLVGARWLSMGLLAMTIGIFAAGIIESRLLTVPFQSVRYAPPAVKKMNNSMAIDEFESIIRQNVFNAEVSDEALTQDVELTVTKPGKNLKQILSNLQLMGISVVRGQYAVCVIRDKKQKSEEIFSIGDTVFNTQAVVRKIRTQRKEQKVYLQLGEEVGVLTYREEPISQNRPIASPRDRNRTTKNRSDSGTSSPYSTDGENFRISSAEVESQLNDFAKLLNQARMVPYFRKGKHRGYQVKAIDKGSVFEKLGLKNHDIIEEVNGEPLNSMEKVMGLFKKFRNEREFTIKLNRKGSPQYMNYYID